MAEYLSPGVYVEEIDSGAKPIEGVSTSTAGVVGVAERGPLDIPILVTSVGEYNRWFGGILDPVSFTDAVGSTHCYLPHALGGFFTNGGKRAYVVRVAPRQAAPAQGDAYWRPLDTIANPLGETVLLRTAQQGTGSTIGLYTLAPAASSLAAGDAIRIGDGSTAEYRDIAAAGITTPVTQHVALDGPLAFAHAAAGQISEHALVKIGLAALVTTLSADAVAGATEIFVNSNKPLDTYIAGLPAGDANMLPWVVQIGAAPSIAVAVVTKVEVVGAGLFRLTLNQPLRSDCPGTTAIVLNQSAKPGGGARLLATDAVPGDLLIFATANGGAAGVIELDQGLANHEVHVVGTLGTIPLTQPLAFEVEAGSTVESILVADDGTVTAKALSAAAGIGLRTLSLSNRVGLTTGQLVRIESGVVAEYATIVAIPGDRGPAPDAGTVTLAEGLVRDHASGASVRAQTAPTAGPRATTRIALDANAGAASLLVTQSAGWAAGDFARVTTPSGGEGVFAISAGSSAAVAATIPLTADLARTHAAGSLLVERAELFQIQALDVGSWGNRLGVSFEDETRGLANTRITVLTPPLQFTVESLTGIEAGSLLEIRNPTTGATCLLKVRRIDRSNGTVTLDPPGLTPAILAALGAITDPLEVRSREFRMTVALRRPPDPAVPSRNTLVLASETFNSLSMDHRHSRYFQRVLGATNGAPRVEDNRPDGQSAYVRVFDSLQDNATEVIRTGPEGLTDTLPGNLVVPATQLLSGGDDSIVTMTDAAYLGADNAEPRLRTGLAALRNKTDVSLVAIPGRGGAALQAGVIAHCELARYRVAILDNGGPDDSIAAVQQQRQLFDSKYAALYYPWLTIPDPMPANLANIGTFALPPSGHVLGVIARTDEDRGVHKAPANEVMMGITGLTRTLQQSEQDVLNPSPVNINVIRDFRPDGRSIRIWGARCITSDQEYKYLNVRRLLNYLEQSIERGLQWVVFEPNAEPLWARVTQTVSNFLTDTWRAGALEGTDPTQGYFVKCDRTTMTQSDIDNGRLICLVGVAPVKPAEFVIIRLGLTTRTTDAS
jgi:phage tail sheath protein FI